MLGAPGEASGLRSPMFHAMEFTDDDHRHLDLSPQSQCSGRSSHDDGAFSTTSKKKWNHSQLSVRGSVGKHSGMPEGEYLRWAAPETPYSPTWSFEHVGGNKWRIQVGRGIWRFGEHPCLLWWAIYCGTHRPSPSPASAYLDVNVPVRPVSPAWFLFSLTGCAHSHDTGDFPTIWTYIPTACT